MYNKMYIQIRKGKRNEKRLRRYVSIHINPCRFCHYKAICNYDIFYNEDHQIELGGQNEER